MWILSDGLSWRVSLLCFLFHILFSVWNKWAKEHWRGPTDSVRKELRIITMMKFTEKRPLSLSHGPFFPQPDAKGLSSSKIVFIWHRARVKAAESKKKLLRMVKIRLKKSKSKKKCVYKIQFLVGWLTTVLLRRWNEDTVCLVWIAAWRRSSLPIYTHFPCSILHGLFGR